MLKIVTAISLFICTVSFAQNWTGNQDANWNNSSNWSSWPLNGEDITINPALYTGNAVSPIISANSVFSPAAVLVTNGGFLTINANLTTSDDVEVIGLNSLIEVNNGVFSVNPGDGGRLIIDLGASMTINGGSTLVDERFIAGEDALVTINNGVVTSGERLIMDLGGRFIQHNGSVTVGATFAMADGSINYNSSYELNDGTLSITGEMGFENEAGNFEPTFIQNGGDMIVNGNVFWFGEAPGLGTPRWLVNNGTVEVTGIIENMPLSTVFMYLRVGGSAEFTFSGTAINTIVPQDTIQLMGTSDFIFENNSTFNNEGVLNGILGSVYILSNLQLNGTGSFQLHDTYIETTGTLNHSTSSDLKIGGDFHKDGNYVTNNNTLVFNGAGVQAVDGNGVLDFYNLTMDNTNSLGVVLGINTTYSGHLQLNDGHLNASALNSFTARDNATTSGASNASYVSGPMNKVGDDAFVYPVGKGQKLGAIAISAPQNVNDVFTAEYFNASYPSITPVNSPLSSVSNLEYWDLNQTNGTSNVTVELFWGDASLSGITDCNELSIANWNGTGWDNLISLASGACTGNGSGSVLSNSATNNYGSFTFGFYNGVTTQNISLCQGEEFIVGTNTYTQAGSYVDVLSDVAMNDSVVLTTIVVVVPNVAVNFLNPGLEADELNAQSYAWLNCTTNSTPISNQTNAAFYPGGSGTYALKITQAGCVDTSDCIDVVFIDTTICNGATYNVGSSNYSTAGDYADVMQNAAMLDSVVFSSVAVFTINTNVSIINYELVAQNTSGDSFEWFNCGTSQVIPNETASIYAPTSNGSYSVTITENGCTSTSDCIDLLTLGTENMDASNMHIFPNPANESVTISGIADDIEVVLCNSFGQIIDVQLSKDGTVQFDLKRLSSGIYLVKIDALKMIQKLILE